MNLSILGIGLVAPEAGARKLEKIGDEADARARRLPRIDRLALVAAKQALGEAPRDGMGLVVGTGWGGLGATVDFLEGLAVRGSPFGSPTAFHESVHHAPAGQISIQLGLTGPSLTASSRELSGEAALKAAVDLVTSGRAPRVLVVCADEIVPALEAAYRAFDSKVLPAEGAAALLIGTGPAAVELTVVELGAHTTTTLQFGAPADLLAAANPSGGLLRIAAAARALATAEAGTERELATQSLGGAWGKVTLRRSAQ